MNEHKRGIEMTTAEALTKLEAWTTKANLKLQEYGT